MIGILIFSVFEVIMSILYKRFFNSVAMFIMIFAFSLLCCMVDSIPLRTCLWILYLILFLTSLVVHAFEIFLAFKVVSPSLPESYCNDWMEEGKIGDDQPFRTYDECVQRVEL